ncbi:MAG TPA: TolC family protein, partial [Burkholderiaceae bacterium]
MRSRLASAIALGSLLAGCSMAPVYRVPQAPSAAASYNESPDWKTAAPADATARGDWWTLFHDEQLDALQGQVGNANQDLKAALARLEQARDLTRVARSAYFPLVTAGPTVTRTRSSLNSPRYVAGKANPANDFALDAEVSYEVDLWGRLRNTVASARASEQASVGDLAALDLSIRSELAVDYFTL